MSSQEETRKKLRDIFYKNQDDGGTFYHNQATDEVMQLIEARERAAEIAQKRQTYMEIRQMLLDNKQWSPLYKTLVTWMKDNGYEIATAELTKQEGKDERI